MTQHWANENEEEYPHQAKLSYFDGSKHSSHLQMFKYDSFYRYKDIDRKLQIMVAVRRKLPKATSSKWARLSEQKYSCCECILIGEDKEVTNGFGESRYSACRSRASATLTNYWWPKRGPYHDHTLSSFNHPHFPTPASSPFTLISFFYVHLLSRL